VHSPPRVESAPWRVADRRRGSSRNRSTHIVIDAMAGVDADEPTIATRRAAYVSMGFIPVRATPDPAGVT